MANGADFSSGFSLRAANGSCLGSQLAPALGGSGTHDLDNQGSILAKDRISYPSTRRTCPPGASSREGRPPAPCDWRGGKPQRSHRFN